MGFWSIEARARLGPSRAPWNRLTTTSVKARAARHLALDVQRLCCLAALEETVRGRRLQSLSLHEGGKNELVNCTREHVRLLALSSVGSFSLVV